jgi:hypothetical protein
MGSIFPEKVKDWYEDQTKGDIVDPEDTEYKLAMQILGQEDSEVSNDFTNKTGYYIDSEGTLRKRETKSERISKAAQAVQDLESQQSQQVAKGQMVQEAQIPVSRGGYRPTNVGEVTKRLLRAPNYEKGQREYLNSLLGTRVASRSNPYITSLI